MAEDKHDDDDDDDKLVHVPRQPKNLAARKSLPSVESALDDFIISANQKPLDVEEFTPETREQALRDEIAALKKKLAAAEAREPAAVEPPADSRRGTPWGAIAAAFAAGAVLAFGAARLTSSASSPAVTAQTPAPLPQTVGPAPAPVPEPAPAAQPAPPAPAETPPPAPAQTAAPPAVATKQPAKPPKTPKEPNTPKEPKAATPDHAAPPAPKPDTPKPAPIQDGSGSDLYNPF